MLAKEFNDSKSSIYRYIRLNYLIPELLEIKGVENTKKITKKKLREFARAIKNENIGHFYTLYVDGTCEEEVDCIHILKD